jgi:hypothetical protein
MPTLYSWEARRAGSSITISHSCGKIVGVMSIKPDTGHLIATRRDGNKFRLHVA